MGEGERACTRQEKTKTPTEGERKNFSLPQQEREKLCGFTTSKIMTYY